MTSTLKVNNIQDVKNLTMGDLINQALEMNK